MDWIVYKEKPYYTDEEYRQHLLTMIEAAEKADNMEALFYYASLLSMHENKSEMQARFSKINLRKERL